MIFKTLANVTANCLQAVQIYCQMLFDFRVLWTVLCYDVIKDVFLQQLNASAHG